MSDSLQKLLESLTEDQKRAVASPCEGRLRISAGAGSGKTEVLTRRIAAILHQGVRSEELVAITYTQKAAAEMKSRLVDRKRVTYSQLRNLEVSTFHSFLSRFLKQDPFGAGIDRSESVISENNRQLVMAELIEKFAQMHGDKIILGDEALGAEVALKLIQEFPAALSKIRRFLLTPSEFYQISLSLLKKRNAIVGSLEQNCLEWLYRFYTSYMQELRDRGYLDFDEILIKGRDLVKDMREQGFLPARRVFLIDEFQDNNADQMNIVKLFCQDRPGHITVVGDEKQSIYRFQGADIDTFRNFPSDTDIILSDNFRSYAEIIKLADSFLELGGETGKMFVPQVAVRGNSPRFPTVSCLMQPDEMPVAEFCENLADMIDQLVKSGLSVSDHKCSRPVKFGDMAIIVSSIRAIPAEFEDALAARQIPYLMSGGLSFYARNEIEEILSFLRILSQPEDDHSLVKILTGPLYGLRDSELAELSQVSRHDKTALLPHILALKEDQLPQKAREFRNLFVQLKKKSASSGLLELCHTILEQAGFYELAASQESELKKRRMTNNVGKFLSIVRNFEQSGIFTSLRDFLNYIERMLLADIDEDEAGLGLEEGEAIKILTIHKSKGLEFPIVFCPFLKRRKYRVRQKIFFNPDQGLMVNDPAQPGRKGIFPQLDDYLKVDEQASDSEDRRKLYVAFTRARNLLVISGKASCSVLPEKETAQTEPIYDVCRILADKPDIGAAGSIETWPEVLQQWLAAGKLRPEQPQIHTAPAPQIEELSSNLRSLADFSAIKEHETEKAASELEIYSLQDLSLFRSCPRKYFFTSCHISSFKEKTSSKEAVTGTMVHETIRIFHAQKGHEHESLSERTDMAEKILGRLAPLYAEHGMKAIARAQHILEHYLDSDLGCSAPWLTEAEINIKFNSATGPFFIRGFADRVDRSEAGIRILDYKTMHYSPEIHARFETQMALYQIASRRGVLGESGCLNFPESCIAYLSTKGLNIVTIEPDLQAFEHFVKTVVEEIRAQKSWSASSEPPCADCGFAILCHHSTD